MPSPNITGRTSLIAHIGHPTEGFRSPSIYNPWFREVGVDVVVVPMGCRVGDYPDLLRALFRLTNLRGALITMPLKVATAGLVDRLSPEAAICGACNAVRLGADGALEGDMFDGAGFVRTILEKGRAISGETGLVVGCGGVGSAIAAALAANGIAEVRLYDPAPGTADRLAERLRSHFPHLTVRVGEPEPSDCDIVVNATPLGGRPGDALPVDAARISPTAFVGDVVLNVDATPLIAAARALGCQTQIGSDMLFQQIPAYLDFFALPSTTPEELRKLMEREG